MKIAFTLLIIIFLVFSGYHLTFRNVRLPFFARQFYFTGSEFLFLGVLLGPQFLNLLDRPTQNSIAPFTSLLLGWIGLIFGFQFEWTKIRHLAKNSFTAAVVEGTACFVLVFFAVYFITRLFMNIPSGIKGDAAVVLAATAACTGQSGLALVVLEYGARFGRLSRFLRLISSIDGAVPFVIFGLFFSWRIGELPYLSGLGEFGGGLIILLISCLGALFIFVFFLREARKESELILLLIAVAILAGGMSSILGISPLFVTFLLGILLVNTLREKERIYQILITVEKPAYLAILVFLGANWRLDSAWIVPLAVAFCAYRTLVKVSAGMIVKRLTSSEEERVPVLLGFGLLHQGGLPLAILLDFQQGFSFQGASWIVSLVLFGVLLNDVIGFFSLRRLLETSMQ